MNAKKAKLLRKIARKVVATASVDEPEIGASPAQVIDESGTVLNNNKNVRGIYQFLKNPRQFAKRFGKE